MRHARSLAIVCILVVAACNSRKQHTAASPVRGSVSLGFAGRADQLQSREQFAVRPMDASNVVNALAAKAPNVTVVTGAASQSASSLVPGGTLVPETLAPSMIIRSGNASIEVDSLALGVARVRQLATRVGGFVANSSIQQGGDQGKAATLEIRLPSARFDEAINGLQPIGRVETVNVSAEDVGEEYVDVQARVANARRLEERLIEVLATRTGKLSEILNVERELARVREEIERMEGRARYLRTHSAISTLSINVHEPLPIVGERGSWSVIGDSFAQAWRNFIAFIARLIAALGTLIPAALIAVAAIAGAVTVWRKRFRREKSE